MNFKLIFWGVVTFVLMIGLWRADEIPITVIKILVIAQLIILTVEKAVQELEPKKEVDNNATN